MVKILYTFEINKEQEVDKIEETTNENGEKVSVTKKVKESVPHKFFVAKPSRSLQEEGELWRAKKFSEAVRAGLLTHDLLSKRLQNDDGLLSEPEKKHWAEMYEILFATQKDLQKAHEKPETDWTEDEKKKETELRAKLKDTRKSIRNFEVQKSSLFEMTAETYARNKVIFWYLLYLSYKPNAKGEPEPYFPGKDYNAKADLYEELGEKNDFFVNQTVQKFMQYVTLWFISEVSSPEQFALLVKEVEEEEKQQETSSTPAEKPINNEPV